jgi:hypothetical protein
MSYSVVMVENEMDSFDESHAKCSCPVLDLLLLFFCLFIVYVTTPSVAELKDRVIVSSEFERM